MRAARFLFAAVVVVASFAAGAGVAHANRNEVTVSCENGLTFDMPRGEEGTTVTVFLDNVRVFGPVTVARQGDPVAFSVPAPADRSVPRSWVVVVDSLWNADQRIVRSVPACAPTTTPPPPPATTTTTAPTSTSTSTTSTSTPPTLPSSATTAPATSTTTVAQPAPSTVVPPTTPRTVSSTTSPPPSVPPAGLLPATGLNGAAAVIAALATGAGLLARRAARRTS